MKRKIVKQGRNALTVTLPSEWAKRYGFKAGDEVEIEDLGRGIAITTDKDKHVQSCEFDATRLDEFRNYYLSYFYHKGFDEIRIIYSDPKVLETARKKIDELLGYEIVESGKNYFLIRSISKVDEGEFDAVLRRVFLLIKSMGEECLNAINEKDYKRLAEIRNLEKTNNKLTDFCIRILNKRGHKDNKKIMSVYTLIRDLEQLCDNYKYLCDNLGSLNDKDKIGNDLISFFEMTNAYFAEFYGLFYKFDEKAFSSFIEKKKRLVDDGYSLMKDRSKSETILLHHLINILHQTFEMKGPMFELNLG